MSEFQIITFYEFKPLAAAELAALREQIRSAMRANSIKGTVILAEEGFNATVAGKPDNIANFIPTAEEIFQRRFEYRSLMHGEMPFRRVDVKIKPEIVTLKQTVDISGGADSHVDPARWNELLTDPETLVLDARNDYEYSTGTFCNAINPGTMKFSDLPRFVEKNLDPAKHKRVAMFCTGGIRCEKFVPYMKQLGFDEVYQLRGGILRYLEEIPTERSLWQGECFVFDERVTVDHSLRKGEQPDHSQHKDLIAHPCRRK